MVVYRFAVATALATFCLLVAGGLVSTTESGLACPDWPLCEGQYFPKLVNGKQFEHTHRLVAASVAVMTFALCGLLFKNRRKDRLLTRLGLLASVLVVVQALLGALTVKLALPAWVSSTHQATAMAFFALVVSLAFLTWQRAPRAPSAADAVARGSIPGKSLRGLTWGVIALTYAEIVIGAVMRHTRAGLACGYDFPLCWGTLWPAHGHLGVQVHMLHRVGGMLVAVSVLILAAAIWRSASSPHPVPLPEGKGDFVRGQSQKTALKLLAVTSVLAVVAQILLGVATIWSSRNLLIMSVHSSLGAALLANLIAIYWVANPSAYVPVTSPTASSKAAQPRLEPA